jgi:hypothetical protein
MYVFDKDLQCDIQLAQFLSMKKLAQIWRWSFGLDVLVSIFLRRLLKDLFCAFKLQRAACCWRGLWCGVRPHHEQTNTCAIPSVDQYMP